MIKGFEKFVNLSLCYKRASTESKGMAIIGVTCSMCPFTVSFWHDIFFKTCNLGHFL
jgi:hypothetical protein